MSTATMAERPRIEVVCAWCSRVKVGERYERQAVRPGAVVSHGICPQCMTEQRASLMEDKRPERMTEQVAAALEAVRNYMEGERKHYEISGEPQSHVFRHWQTLDAWIRMNR